MIENESNAISGARAIAIVLVVIGHAMIGNIRTENAVIDFIWCFIYSFHMYFFFCISGMLFEKNINKYISNKYKFIVGKFKLLIIPYIVISLVEYTGIFAVRFILQFMGKGVQIADIGIIDALKAIIFNTGHFDTHLWYIYLLFFIFVINILFLRKNIPVLFIIGLALLVLGYPYLSYVPWKFQSLVYYIVPFVLGRIFYRKDFLKKSMRQSKSKIIAYFLCMLLLNSIIYYLENIYMSNLFGIPGLKIGVVQNIKYLTGFLGSILLIYFGHRFIHCSLMKPLLKCLDKYSYEIYLYHQPFITVGCATVMFKLRFPVLMIIILSTIIGTMVPIFISKYMMRRNQFLSKLFLGGH